MVGIVGAWISGDTEKEEVPFFIGEGSGVR